MPYAGAIVKTVAVLILMAVAMGCSQGAEALYDSARLEERQNNTEHARQLYLEVVERHPDTEYARLARERLKGLEK